MPDVIIKGMKMPNRCEDCFAYRHNAEYDYAYCNISSVNVLGKGNARLNNCPLSPAPEWISVEERLPEDGKYVLAYSADDDYTTVEASYKFEVFQITHWMPLLNVPKEEQYEC